MLVMCDFPRQSSRSPPSQDSLPGLDSPSCFSTSPCQPAQQVVEHFGAVDLVKRLVPSARVKILRDVVETRATIALHQKLDSLQLLPDGIFAA